MRRVTCPEGLDLTVTLATLNHRFSAFVLDSLIGFIAVATLIALFVKVSGGPSVRSVNVVVAFIWYFYLNFYFLYFELAWRGRTPGKRLVGIRVINRRGGELAPGMVVARNLTRQAEIFLPIALLVGDNHSAGPILQIGIFVFVAVMILMPVLSSDNLRLGDLLGGTLTIVAPKAVLLKDMAEKAAQGSEAKFAFTQAQLGLYGDLELKTLEKALRLAGPKASPALTNIAAAIAKKIKYDHPISPAETVQFLEDFYAAERRVLEMGKLFGRHKESQNSPARQFGQATTPGPKPPRNPGNLGP
ncbi:MAG: RDD family protein [Deltaproteobacteria bacterium]|nr:RDD family protein [Deltaproteobacteria bacterium]